MSWISDWWNGQSKADKASANTAMPQKAFHERALEQLDLLAKLVKQSSNVLSPTVYSRLRSIDDVMRPFMVYISSHDLFMEHQVMVESMLTKYIPEPLNTFLNLQPKDQVEGGKADMLLQQQFDTLEKSARDFVEGIYKGGVASLSTYARFIEDKFGRQ